MNDTRKAHRYTSATCALVSVLLMAGCVSGPPKDIPLSDPRRRRLLKESHFAVELGVEMRREDSKLKFENTHSIPIGSRSLVPFSQNLTVRQKHLPAIDARVNGRSTVTIVDSGVAHSLTDFKTATRVHLKPVAEIKQTPERFGQSGLVDRNAQTAVAKIEEYVAMGRSLEFGGLVMYNVPFGIINDKKGFNALPWITLNRVELLLGHDFLSAFKRATFDRSRGQVILSSAPNYDPDPESLIAAGTFDPRLALPSLEAKLDDKGPFPVVLSTGADFGLMIPLRVARALHLPEAEQYLSSKGKKSNDRYAVVDIGRHAVNLSGFEIPDCQVLMNTCEDNKQEPPYALVGSKVLDRYVLTIDYGNKKVYFENPY